MARQHFRLLSLILVVLAVMAGASGAPVGAQRALDPNATAQAAAAAPGEVALHDAMRKLWEDHITWTRLFIVSFAAGLPDQEPTAARLLQNQVDLGDAI